MPKVWINQGKGIVIVIVQHYTMMKEQPKLYKAIIRLSKGGFMNEGMLSFQDAVEWLQLTLLLTDHKDMVYAPSFMEAL